VGRSCFALKGQNDIAQGKRSTALGNGCDRFSSPVGAAEAKVNVFSHTLQEIVVRFSSTTVVLLRANREGLNNSLGEVHKHAQE